MKLLGFELTRQKRQVMSAVPANRGGWRRILESFSGAWQQNIEVSQQDLICYPTLYACLKRVSEDIGVLPFQLRKKGDDGIWDTVENSAYSPVLRKPNTYQTAQQFREAWILSKKTQGNAYVLLQRDQRNVITSMYVLDPCRVQPMVTESGAVYYQLQTDRLNKLPENYPADRLLVPATDIIHDRCMPVHHWLVGIPPICAAYWPAVKNLKILKSSAEFFANNSTPGGILTAPAGMTDDDATAVQEYWKKFQENPGLIAVIGADMKFTGFTMKGADAQLVEQMKYSDEQIAQPFGIPPFKIGIGSIPAGLGVDAINLLYYDDALRSDIEAMENLIDEAFGLASDIGIWLDTQPLLRMDVGKQADVESKLVGAKIKTPNEGRSQFNLPATAGGETLWGQQQDYPLGMLSNRADWDPNMQREPVMTPEPDPVDTDAVETDLTDKALYLLYRKAPESFAHA